jgi:hypothetical protein
MPQVDAGGETFLVYADLDTATTYSSGALHATVWAASDDDTRSKALVTATRMLDRQTWKGTRADPAQALAWPRANTGVADVVPTVVPGDIVAASIELAFALLEDTTIQSSPNTAEKIHSITAGSVSITNFRTAVNSNPTRFPQIVQELVARYLGSSSGLAIGAKATGTDGESIFPNDFGIAFGAV